MALIAGTVVVASDESVTGAGWARALYDADIATFTAQLPDPAVPPAHFDPALWLTTAKAIRLAALRERARQANAYATANVSTVVASAAVTIPIAAHTPFGKTPNPNTPDTILQGFDIPTQLLGTVS